MSTHVAWQVNHKSLQQSKSTKPAASDYAEVCLQYLYQCQQEVKWVVIEIKALTSTTAEHERYLGWDYTTIKPQTVRIWRQDWILCITSADTIKYWEDSLWRFCLLYKDFGKKLWGAAQVRILRLWIHPRSLETDQIQPAQQREKKRTTSKKSHKNSKMMLTQKIVDNIIYCTLHIIFHNLLW